MSVELQIPLVVMPHAQDLGAPSYATAGSAGCDLRAAVTEALTLAPGARAMVPTGLRLALPSGHEGQVRPRSGLAVRHGVTTLNAPGTIDADFRGEIHVILVNHGDQPFVVRRGDRVAQLVVAAYTRAVFDRVDELDDTERGAGGFGSTGR